MIVVYLMLSMSFVLMADQRIAEIEERIEPDDGGPGGVAIGADECAKKAGLRQRADESCGEQ